MIRATTDGERGSATVWVLALAALLGVIGGASTIVAGGLVAHRRAASAADLTALAAASRSVTDESVACGAAADAARANGAVLLRCHVDGASVEVVVAVDPSLRWLPTMQVAARAGFASSRQI